MSVGLSASLSLCLLSLSLSLICFSVYSLSPGQEKSLVFTFGTMPDLSFGLCQSTIARRSPTIVVCLYLSVRPSVRQVVPVPPSPTPLLPSPTPFPAYCHGLHYTPPPAPLAPEAGSDVVRALEDDVLRARDDDAHRHRFSRTPRRARPGPSRVLVSHLAPRPNGIFHDTQTGSAGSLALRPSFARLCTHRVSIRTESVTERGRERGS